MPELRPYSFQTTAWKAAKHILLVGGAAAILAVGNFLSDPGQVGPLLPPHLMPYVPLISGAGVALLNWAKNGGRGR